MLVQKRAEFAERKKEIGRIFDIIGDSIDFMKVDSIGGRTFGKDDDNAARSKVFDEFHRDLNLLGKEVERLEDAEKARKNYLRTASEIKQKAPKGTGNKALDEYLAELESIKNSGLGLGDHFVQSPEYKRLCANPQAAYNTQIKGWYAVNTARGFKADATVPVVPDYRTGVVSAGDRPLTVLEILPRGRTASDTIKWDLETTRMTAAAARAQGAGYSENSWVVAEQSLPIVNLGTFIPIYEERLEDAPWVATTLNRKLTRAVNETVESQALNGTGVGNNAKGILKYTGVVSTARGASTKHLIALSREDAAIATNGKTYTSHIIMNPSDWHLTRTSDPFLRNADPANSVRQMVLGIPVVLSLEMTAGTVALGNFRDFSTLHERLGGVEIQSGLSGTNFTDGKVSVRGRHRVAVENSRVTAFRLITSYNVAVS